jgi:hypothetical protein
VFIGVARQAFLFVIFFWLLFFYCFFLSRSAISRNGPYHYRLMDGLLMLSMVGATLPAAPSVRKQKSIAFSMLLNQNIALLAF